MNELGVQLLSSSHAARIRALHHFASSSKVDWSGVAPYFERILAPDANVPEDELHLAVEAAVRSPIQSVHELVIDLATHGRGNEQAEALMALARSGEATSEQLIRVLEAGDFAGPRDLVAEHLLLLDVAPVKNELETCWRREGDPKVRFWVSGALAKLGEDDALKEELQKGEIPQSLLTRVEVKAHEPLAYCVKPRMERIHQPEPQSAAGAMPPAAAAAPAPRIEVREGGPGPAPPADVPPTRFFEGRAPDRVKLGETIGVQLRIAMERAEDVPTTAISIDVPPEGLTVTITAHTPGFEFEGSQQLQQLLVPADSDSDWALYRLKAMKEGVHDLTFTAFHPEGRMLGDMQVQVSVDALATTAKSREVRSVVPSMQGDEGEVSLTIDWLEEQAIYRFQLIDRSMPEEVLTDHLLRSPREIVESLVNDLASMAKGQLGQGQSIRRMLRDRGVQLWTELIPDALKDQFWERQPRIKSLRILARKDPIPWEVLYPLSATNDAGFLVEQFPVLRSIRGLEPVTRIGSGPVETVVPSQSSPTSAANEADMVRRVWSARSIGPQVGTLADLRNVLDGANFGILHLACHNSFDPNDPGRTNIRFADGDFNPVVLAPLIATRALAGATPLVFVNACRSGGEAPLYTELSGWATDFMRAGSGAFLGSLWAVRDSSARTFAETFYEKMTGGASLGGALVEARKAIATDDDPTWLAYTAYGDPAATV